MAISTVLVTGATGYVGGRLVPELLGRGYKVRCFARSPEKLRDQPWFGDIEVAKGDLSDSSATEVALNGVDAAYYLVHSMNEATGARFASQDDQFAATFRDAAARCDVQRIVYLGGLGKDADPRLSDHLQSRHQVGDTLREGSVAITELRAAIIIGSGSASFEMLRSLVDVLPVMITPRWVRSKCQPIAIRDVIHYLLECLETPETADRIIEIGGPEVLTYQQMMNTYAEQAQLKHRLVLPVPFLTPKLSSLWVGLVTPLPTSLAKPLIHGVGAEVIVSDSTATTLMPHDLMAYEEACALSIKRTRDLEVTTHWAGAELGHRSVADPQISDPEWSGGTVLSDSQTVTSNQVTAHEIFRTVEKIGGDNGWLIANFLWRLRGAIDKLIGGTGLRRGRRNPDTLRVGDALDFWRVEALVPDALLRLRAEMRLPGKAWLEWTISEDDGTAKLMQHARYQPRGLAGRLYWYSLFPFHFFIFKRLAHAIVKRSEDS